MIIEIKGVQFVNKGAELMLHAVLQQLQTYNKDIFIVLAPNANSPYKDRMKVGSYQKFSLRKKSYDFNSLAYYIPKPLRGWLIKAFGVVTEADVDVVLDASGFSYGDQWPLITIKNTSNEIIRLKKKGKKYIFLPQALGPFNKAAYSDLVRKGFSNASLICAREQTSYDNTINSVFNKDIIKLYPDFTNLVRGTVGDDYSYYSDKILIIPNCNMISTRNNNSEWKATYIQFLTNSALIIKELGFIPILLNHEGDADGEICNRVLQLLGENIDTVKEADPLKVKGIIGSSKAIICSRFHGCVSALTQAVPCLGTSWSHKYEKLFEEYTRSEYLLSPNITKDELHKKLISVIENVDNDDYTKKIQKYKNESELMWRDIFKVLDEVNNV
ncbi:polysaccharide pyruvyl transferase family protein [Pseudoalteromonas nigrifaciens]|uniref:polysaccharide pyruvyl transferase family protein n=1 Tax=Pseudoalteromonas nigrifaciens TaxID=28109 RepID=UPI003FB7A0DB